MSYQGTKWAQKVRGCNRGEKAILMQLGAEQDQRTNLIRMSVGELSLASDMNERQVRRILQQLEIKHVIKQIGGGLGKGNKSIYSFVSFAITKADILGSQKRTLATAKADIPDTKSGHSGQRNKEVIRSKELQKQEGEENPRPVFSRSDFDERDLRMMGQALRKAMERDPERRSLIDCLTPLELLQFQCEFAGISVERGQELQMRSRSIRKPVQASA